MKVCRLCNKEQLISSYYKSTAHTRDGYRHECKVCTAKQNAERHAANKVERNAKQREKHYVNQYSLTISQVEEMKEVQDNKCLCCDKETKLVVDHCHTTGKVRGLLCSPCNQALGSVYENTTTLQNMITYLSKE